MNLNKVKLTELVTKSFSHKKLTKKETRKMLEALWEKYWKQELNSFQEKVVLSSYILFPDPENKKERDNYIKEVLARSIGASTSKIF